MSIYRQFIESSQPMSQQNQQHSRQQVVIKHVHFNQIPPQEQVPSANAQQDSMFKSRNQTHFRSMSPLASAISSTISSTPISKHQYKRLVESNEAAHYHANYHTIGASQPNIQQLQHANTHHHHHQHLQQAPPSLSMANIHTQQTQHQQRRDLSVRSNSSCISVNSNASRPNIYQQRQPPHFQTSCKLPMEMSQHKYRRNLFNTDDPVLLKWMQAMRFETELECLTALQARTLAIDENSAAALSVRNSQVAIQEMRLDSDLILDLIDALIEALPVNLSTIDKLAMDFSEIHARLLEQARVRTCSQATTTIQTYCNQLDNLTIINCTPRKSLLSARTSRPLDKLAIEIREVSNELAAIVSDYQQNYKSHEHIDNGQLEAMLRKIKELLGKFTEISIQAECANIVRALEHDFGLWPTNSNELIKLTSNSSLHPVRPFESCSAQLPLKWALIALWQLTREDGYICRTLTELEASLAKPRSAKRLDYSTKYDDATTTNNSNNNNAENQKPDQDQHSLRSEYERLHQICQSDKQFRERQQKLQRQQQAQATQGALSSALKSRQPVKQVSTIELLIEIIISQPNRHERLDMMNFAQNNKLVELEDLGQTISAAFYTSNQYKVAALRILNHLCINEQAVRKILRCFYTPPPNQGQATPENKIIKSIFGCYQTAQEHIYQNETMIQMGRTRQAAGGRKRARRPQCHLSADQQQQHNRDSEEYSDYGSVPTSEQSATGQTADQDHELDDEEGDDEVVREAIQLLFELTTPFHKSVQGHDFYRLIGPYSIESLVKYLTNIVRSTSNRKMLLLSLSVLANISFITTEQMNRFGTIRVMLEMLRGSRNRSKDLELRDQATTILANAADANPPDVVSNGGLTFLLSCLEVCPTRMANYRRAGGRVGHSQEVADYQEVVEDDVDQIYANQAACNMHQRQRWKSTQIENTPRDRKPIDLSDEFLDDLDCACDNQQAMLQVQPSCLARLSVGEMAALERIHQKTAVAFARMSTDPVTTRMILDFGGVKQLIDMCKLSHKRNHSDTILIACLAALQKMSRWIEPLVFRDYNASDLIELEPNKALKIYGCLYSSELYYIMKAGPTPKSREDSDERPIAQSGRAAHPN